MKKVAVLISCITLMLFMGSSDASAAKVLNDVVDMPWFIPNPCANEVIRVEARAHLMIHETTNKKNAQIRLFTHVRGIGVGLVSGNVYKVNYQFQASSKDPLEVLGSAVVAHQQVRVRLQSLDKALPDLESRDVLKLTINANGETTVDVVESVVNCD